MELGETDVEEMKFPAMGLDAAFEAFTKAAYGHALALEHE